MSHYRSTKAIPSIPAEAKRYALDPLSSSESEEESNESYHSDESSEPVFPVRHYSNQYGTPSRERKYREEVKRRPFCGVAMQNRQSGRRLSTISSSTNSTNEDLFDPAPQYSAINKPRWKENRLDMIQELSPIQPCLASSSPRDFAPPPPLSREMREWRPKHTSSVINVPTFPMLPKTNPLHPPYFPSPRTTKNSLELQPYDELLDQPPRRDFISDMSSDSSFFDLHVPKPQPMRRGIITSSPKKGRGSSQPVPRYRLTCELEGEKEIRPEDFHLPAPVAKVWKARGIVFLKVELFNGQLFIYVERAEYFSENRRRKHRSTYITLEMNHKSRDRGESNRKRSSQRSLSTTTQMYRTKTVEATDQPAFNKMFTFNLTERNQRDSITISVIEKEHRPAEMNRRKQLGCFTFHISQILKKAEKSCHPHEDDSFVVQVINDGYFILDSEKGKTQNFPMSKIVRSTNYTLDGPSSTSSSSLNVHSPQKMLRSSEWPASSSSAHLPSRSSSAVPPPATQHMDHRTRPRPFSYMEGHQGHHQRFSEDLKPSTESFATSTGSSSVDYDFNRHRMTLPSITTTSSSITSDEGPSCSSSAFNSSFLHPGGGGGGEDAGKNGKSAEDSSDRKPSRQEGGVRRAASFTYSPTGSQGKHNRRPEAVVGKEDEAAKKKLFGGLSKMFSSIGSKVASAISTSSLYPTRDEIRQWDSSFEALLNHKFGQMLFAQFLETEHSSENLDFWLECEKYKKMEDGKKMTTRANEIYAKFIAPLSPREVNLDSDTRAATKVAMEGGCRQDTFSLAQGKIEHLMATDTYRRFLKHKIYLDVLHHADGGKSDESAENGSGAK